MIWNIEIRGENGSDDLSHGCRSSVCLNGVPKQCSDSSNDDRKAREVPAERRAHGNWEGNMQVCSNHSVEYQRYSADKRAEYNTVNCFAPAKCLVVWETVSKGVAPTKSNPLQ